MNAELLHISIDIEYEWQTELEIEEITIFLLIQEFVRTNMS